MKTLLILAGTIVAFSAITEEPKPSEKQSKTKLESFEAKAGSVIIKGFGRAGSIVVPGAVVTVECRELGDAATSSRAYGITIEVAKTGRFDGSERAFVDLEEIESLVKGIEYIAKVDKAVTKLADFEATYKTNGDLQITTFSGNKNGSIEASVSCGRFGSNAAFLSLEQLAALKELISKAKTMLDAVRG